MDTKDCFCQKAYLAQTIYSWIVLSIKISDNFNANWYLCKYEYCRDILNLLWNSRRCTNSTEVFFSLHLRFRFKKLFLVIIVSCCGMYTTLQYKHNQHQTAIYGHLTGHWDHGIICSRFNQKWITMKWLSWMVAHNYLFAVSRCCAVGSGKGFTRRTERFLFFCLYSIFMET